MTAASKSVPCHRCGHPVAADGWLLLGQAGAEGAAPIDYPRSGVSTAAYFLCEPCAVLNDERDNGYDVQLSRIRSVDSPRGDTDSLRGWVNHLRMKMWWSDSLLASLARAHDVARGAR